MNFFKKLFSSKQNNTGASVVRPDNTKLLFYINNWVENPSRENYRIVVEEFTNGDSYLLLPSINDENITNNDWQTAKTDTTLKLTTIFNLDGLKVLGAFTDEKALYFWAKKPTTYTALASKRIIPLCQENHISRIVINSGSRNMFVMERNKENLKELEIKKDTTVKVGTPAKPLDKTIIDKMIARFKDVDTIEEAYQYVQEMNNEFSIMIGLKLSVNSDNAKSAALNAVQDAMQSEKPGQSVDIFFIDSEKWLNTIRNISDSLFYKK
jgi:hypothetical protein